VAEQSTNSQSIDDLNAIIKPLVTTIMAEYLLHERKPMLDDLKADLTEELKLHCKLTLTDEEKVFYSSELPAMFRDFGDQDISKGRKHVGDILEKIDGIMSKTDRFATKILLAISIMGATLLTREVVMYLAKSLHGG